MITEYYAPSSRVESEDIESIVWNLVKDQFADDTVRWAIVLTHPITGKTAVILPFNWRDIVPDKDPVEQSIKTQNEMEQEGWFPIYEL